LRADPKVLRRTFARSLFAGLKIVWPILSVVLGCVVGLGMLIGWLEGWSLRESLYFAFITGLTIGYGDFVPSLFVTHLLAIFIGLCGLLLTALVAAIAVKALGAALEEGGE